MCPYVPMVLFIRHRGYRWDIEQKHPYNIHKCHFPIHEKYAAVFFMDESWTVAGRGFSCGFPYFVCTKQKWRDTFSTERSIDLMCCVCAFYTFRAVFQSKCTSVTPYQVGTLEKWSRHFPQQIDTLNTTLWSWMAMWRESREATRAKKILFYCKSFRLLTVPLWIESWGIESTSISEYCENNLNSKHCTRSILMCFVCISQNAIYADSRQKFIGHRGMLNHRPAQNIESKPNSVWFEGVC